MDPPVVAKRRQTQPQPQLLMRVVPLSTMANGESKNEVGEHITSVCRKDEAVSELLYLSSTLKELGKKEEEEGEGEERGKHVH